jgi:hypothetical protein
MNNINYMRNRPEEAHLTSILLLKDKDGLGTIGKLTRKVNVLLLEIGLHVLVHHNLDE